MQLTNFTQLIYYAILFYYSIILLLLPNKNLNMKLKDFPIGYFQFRKSIFLFPRKKSSHEKKIFYNLIKMK
jgi:hypothetical protein